MKNYRFTIANNYPQGMLGHHNPKGREGYFQEGSSPEDARQRLAEQLNIDPNDLELDENW